MNIDNISYLIDILRFPLAYCVVLIHCNYGGYKYRTSLKIELFNIKS